MHLALAAIFGYGGKGVQSIDDVAEYVPVSTVAKAEFDRVLQGFNLPVDDGEVQC